jgi:hypothetical protein
MNEKDDPRVTGQTDPIEKLRKIKALSSQLAEEDNPQLQNNMEIVLSLVNELLFLMDHDYERT